MLIFPSPYKCANSERWCVHVCNLRTIRPGWTSGSSRRGEASATSPTRATTLGGRSTRTSTVWFTPNISSWPPTWMTWRRTPSAQELPLPDALRATMVKGPSFPLRTVYHGSREKVVGRRRALQKSQSREEPSEAPGHRQVLRRAATLLFCTISKHSICFVLGRVLFYFVFLMNHKLYQAA